MKKTRKVEELTPERASEELRILAADYIKRFVKKETVTVDDVAKAFKVGFLGGALFNAPSFVLDGICEELEGIFDA